MSADADADRDAHGIYFDTVADCDTDHCPDPYAFACPDCDAHLHHRAVPKSKRRADDDPSADTDY